MKTATITPIAHTPGYNAGYPEVDISVTGDDGCYRASMRPRRDGAAPSINYIVGWSDKRADPGVQGRIEAACLATLADGQTRTVVFGAPATTAAGSERPEPPRDPQHDQIYNEGYPEGYNPGAARAAEEQQ